MKTLSLDALVKNTKDIPALPTIVVKLLNLLDSQESSGRQVSDLMMSDQSLVAKILKLANSAYYGRSREITTVQGAVSLLGFKAVKEIALSVGMSGLYNREFKGYGLEKGLLWRHSLAVAIASGIIARKVQYPVPEEAYIGGLLHDVGKLIVDQHIQGVTRQILDKSEAEKIPFAAAEKETLGFDHTDVGALVAEKWNMPDRLIEVIRCHHEPMKAQVNPPLVAVVHIANCLILTLGIGMGYEGLKVEISQQAVESLDLTELDLEGFLGTLVEMVGNDSIYKL